MIRVNFQNFRCFTVSNPVEIRPITLLIGENSTGKTSFLGGLRFIFEAMRGTGGRNVFNRDPYFLGSFQEIAHSRIRSRPTSNFAMRIEIEDTGAAHEFTCTKGEPQPELSKYEFASQNDKINVDFSGEESSVSLSFLDIPERSQPFLPPDALKSLMSAQMLRENILYLGVIFDHLGFQLKRQRGGTETKQAVPEDRLNALTRRFQTSASYLRRHVFASAPVRTQPHRTYTPSEVAASSEGDQVPLELARAKLRSPQRWIEIQKGLASFGRDSGLFTNVDIRQFGKSDIDPFQVLVRIGSARRNIVDVGYGVSQALPIVYQIQNPGQYDTFLLQQPEVHLHPRAQAELGALIADKISRNRDHIYVIETHSDYIIDRLRILIAEGVLDCSKVTLIFFQKRDYDCVASNIYLNDSGEIGTTPTDFRSFFIEEHAKLLGI